MHILNNFIDNKLTKCNLDAILISKVGKKKSKKKKNKKEEKEEHKTC